MIDVRPRTDSPNPKMSATTKHSYSDMARAKSKEKKSPDPKTANDNVRRALRDYYAKKT